MIFNCCLFLQFLWQCCCWCCFYCCCFSQKNNLTIRTKNGGLYFEIQLVPLNNKDQKSIHFNLDINTYKNNLNYFSKTDSINNLVWKGKILWDQQWRNNHSCIFSVVANLFIKSTAFCMSNNWMNAINGCKVDLSLKGKQYQ